MSMVKANDINMYYESHSKGEPLFLISGNGIDSSRWKSMLPVFSKKYRTIVFDNRDVGRTDKTDMPYTTETMADDVVGTKDAPGIKKAHILGTSPEARLPGISPIGTRRG